jgi:hypothetical protein
MRAASIQGTGERYCYAHFLLYYFFFKKFQVENVFLDIMCKFKPYSDKIRALFSKLPEAIPENGEDNIIPTSSVSVGFFQPTL